MFQERNDCLVAVLVDVPGVIRLSVCLPTHARGDTLVRPLVLERASKKVCHTIGGSPSGAIPKRLNGEWILKRKGMTETTLNVRPDVRNLGKK